MKYGVSLFPLRPQQIIDVTLKAEALGFDSVWLGEHVVTPVVNESSFPYAGEEGKPSHDAVLGALPFYDPYAVLCYLSAITTTIRLALSVSIVPLHDPYHLARSVTTLDLFSKGRFLFGMGSGWLEEEFAILGRDFASRGQRFDETLDVMTSLFSQDVTEFNGKSLKVPPMAMTPKPMTLPHPPFIFGGHAKVALRRAAQRGDGWLATELSPQEIAVALAELEKFRREAGRADQPFEISCHINQAPDAAMVERYAKAGVHRLVVRPWTKGRDAVPNLMRLAEQLRPFE